MVVVFIPSPISSQEKNPLSHRKYLFWGFLSLLHVILLITTRHYFSLNDNYLSLKCSVSKKPRQHLQPTSVLLWVSKYCVLLPPCKRWTFPLCILHKDSVAGLKLNTKICKTLYVCYVFHTSSLNVNIGSLWHLFDIWGFSISSFFLPETVTGEDKIAMRKQTI